MFQQNAADLQHGQRVLVDVEVVGRHDQLGFGVVEVGAGVRHDAVARLVAAGSRRSQTVRDVVTPMTEW